MTRLCDAHWTLVCEEVRKIAPVIGNVGQWRAHCEGGWAGEVPGDLIDLADATRLQESKRLDRVSEEAEQGLSVPLNGVNTTFFHHSQHSDKSSDLQVLPSPTTNHIRSPIEGARPMNSNQSLTLPTAGASSSQRSISPTIPQPSSPAQFSPENLSDTRSISSPILDRPADAISFPFPGPGSSPAAQPIPLSRQRTPPGDGLSDSLGRLLDPPTRISDRRKSGEGNGATTPNGGTESKDLQLLERDTRALDPARTAPRTTFANISGGISERPKPIGRSMSIDSNASSGSHVAAMRERYNNDRSVS